MVVVNVLLRVLRFARWLLFDVFGIVVVVGWLLRTTSSQGLCFWLICWFSLFFCLLAGCAACHKLFCVVSHAPEVLLRAREEPSAA